MLQHVWNSLSSYTVLAALVRLQRICSSVCKVLTPRYFAGSSPGVPALRHLLYPDTWGSHHRSSRSLDRDCRLSFRLYLDYFGHPILVLRNLRRHPPDLHSRIPAVLVPSPCTLSWLGS